MEVFRRAAEGRAIGMKRKWRLPPPLIQEGDGPGPVGLAVLEDFPNELGTVLWKSLRSTLLWAEQDVDSRRGLFEEGSADRRQLEILATVPEDAPDLRDSLEDLLAILERPERTDREFASVACTRIATWAEGRGARSTMLEYLQAAAAASPADPVPALAAGRLARDLARYGRAEVWIQRAIILARQRKDWATYVDAYRAQGTMMRQRGVLPAARRSYLKALRRSRRQRDREREAMTLHGLFVIEHRAGNFAEAAAHATSAVRAYPPDHPRFPHLAHDIAYDWVERGDAASAVPVFFRMLNKVAPNERPLVLGSIGRASGFTADAEGYAWARRELEAYGDVLGASEAWVDLARGAVELGREDEAEEAARKAEGIARRRREGQMRFLAETIMEDIHAERARIESAKGRALADPTRRKLARDIIRSLEAAPDRGLLETVR